MKLTVATDSVYPLSMGGSHRLVYELCKELGAQGHDTECIVAGPADAVQDHNGFRIVTYRRPPGALRKALSFIFSSARTLRERIAASGPPTCLSVQFMPALLGMGAGLRRTLPMYYVYYGSHAKEMLSHAGPRFLRTRSLSDLLGYLYALLFLLPAEKWLLATGRFPVVVLSEHSRREVMRTFGVGAGRISIIPGGCNTDQFQHSTSGRERLRKAWGVTDDALVVISVRRLEPRMGLDRLITAFAHARTGSKRSMKLVIGGRGSYRTILEQTAAAAGLSADDLLLTGFIPDGELADYYSASDLFVMPSLSVEGFGLPVLEAMACGLPVAATPGGGHTELVQALAPQLVTADTSVAAIADLLAKVENGALRLPQAQACIDYARTFSWQRHARMHLDLIATLAAAAP